MFLAQSRDIEADAIATYLDANFDRAIITANLPRNLHDFIRDHYIKVSTGKGLVVPDPGRISGLKNQVRVREILGSGPDYTDHTRFMLARALLWDGHIEEAKATMLHSLNRPGPTKWGYYMLSDLSWVLRTEEQAQAALDYIEAHRAKAGDRLPEMIHCEAERARCLIAIGRKNEARLVLDAAISESKSIPIYSVHADLLSLRARLCEPGEDPANFLQRATHGAWRSRQGGTNPIRKISGFSAIYVTMLGRHEPDRATAADLATQIMLSQLGQHGDGSTFNALLRSFSTFDGDGLIDMWDTVRGIAIEEQTIARNQSLRETIRAPILLATYTELSRRLFPRGMNESQDSLLWTLCEDGFEAFQRGDLNKNHLPALAMTYKGLGGSLAWKQVADQLPKQLRGLLAYVFAHRHQRLGQAESSAAFFSEAEALASESPILRSALDADAQPE